jgi:hypothetical protein
MKTSFLLFTLVLVLGCLQVQAQHCGTWRWAVKTLTDADGARILSSKPKITTITDLAAEKAPQKLSTRHNFDGRISGEQDKVLVDAVIIKCKLEPDKDYHLVLQDPNTNATLVSEIPSPNCDNLANAPELRERYKKLRAWIDSKINITTSMNEVDPPIEVQVEGVAFWDAPHGATGASDEGREIHPITDFNTASGSVFATFTPPVFTLAEVPDKPKESASPQEAGINPDQMLTMILLASILGMAGQVVRFIAGLRKSASGSTKAISEVIDNKQMLLGLLISLIVGGVAGVLASINMTGKPLDNSVIIAFLAAGYAGTDLIEGFIMKKQ